MIADQRASETNDATSMRKQALYTQYAKGKLSRRQLTEEIGKIQPPATHVSRRRKIAMIVAAILAAALIPPSARRDS